MNVLFVFALTTEIPDGKKFPHAHIFTGVGKINAATELALAIALSRPDLVINYGSAGAMKGATGLVRCGTFIEMDMNVEALGFAPHVCPSDSTPFPLTFGEGAVCGTADKFVTSKYPDHYADVDVVDMEAFALAKVCHKLGTKFVSYKYISDNADGESASVWEENQAKGYELFMDVVNKMGL